MAVAIGNTENVELAAHYYLENFLSLCETVENQYGDLLNAQEQDFLKRFYSLDHNAQCLYVRLISRLGPWFRVGKLVYPEIGDMVQPVQSLLAAQAVVTAEELTVAELGRLFTRAEIQDAYQGLLPDSIPAGKAGLLAAVDELSLAGEQHLALFKEALQEELISPTDVEVVDLLQILFFGNRRQGLTDFVLSDLGIARYYPYPLNRRHRLFPCREALDEYLYCCEFQDLFYQFLELDDDQGMTAIASAMIEWEVCFPESQRRWERVCNSVARELERRKNLDLALQLYECSNRHPARERRARILEAKEDWQGVVSLCETIISSPLCEEEWEAAQRILPRIQRKLGGRPVARQKDEFREIGLRLQQRGECVELAAAAHLQKQWARVYYVENSLMNTLFGLAFWQQIFADVPGAFHNQYQGVPRDMYDGSFTPGREKEINARLRALKAGNLREELMAAYRRYSGFQCHWADWRTVDESLLDAALQAIPAQHLFAIWERQLFDPAENRSGFPDLIAFAGTGEGRSTEYCMIEVKGPGDSLQNNQKRWLRYFSEHSIPAAVAWVEWEDA